jgi:hypothetical protein
MPSAGDYDACLEKPNFSRQGIEIRLHEEGASPVPFTATLLKKNE